MRNPFGKDEPVVVPVPAPPKGSLDEARDLLEILGNPENQASALGDAQIRAREWVRAFDG